MGSRFTLPLGKKKELKLLIRVNPLNDHRKGRKEIMCDAKNEAN